MIIAMCVHPKSLSLNVAVGILKQNVSILNTFEVNNSSIQLKIQNSMCASQVFIMELRCGDFETKSKYFDCCWTKSSANEILITSQIRDMRIAMCVCVSIVFIMEISCGVLKENLSFLIVFVPSYFSLKT